MNDSSEYLNNLLGPFWLSAWKESALLDFLHDAEISALELLAAEADCLVRDAAVGSTANTAPAAPALMMLSQPAAPMIRLGSTRIGSSVIGEPAGPWGVSIKSWPGGSIVLESTLDGPAPLLPGCDYEEAPAELLLTTEAWNSLETEMTADGSVIRRIWSKSGVRPTRSAQRFFGASLGLTGLPPGSASAEIIRTAWAARTSGLDGASMARLLDCALGSDNWIMGRPSTFEFEVLPALACGPALVREASPFLVLENRAVPVRWEWRSTELGKPLLEAAGHLLTGSTPLGDAMLTDAEGSAEVPVPPTAVPEEAWLHAMAARQWGAQRDAAALLGRPDSLNMLAMACSEGLDRALTLVVVDAASAMDGCADPILRVLRTVWPAWHDFLVYIKAAEGDDPVWALDEGSADILISEGDDSPVTIQDGRVGSACSIY